MPIGEVTAKSKGNRGISLPGAGGGGGGSQPHLVFASDWSTSTGISDAALRDTNSVTPWSESHNGSASQLISVISASGLGFPSGMTNVFQVEYNNEDSAEMRALNIWPLPAIGSSLFFRHYYRGNWSDSFTSMPEASHHPWEPIFGTCPGIWEWKVGPYYTGANNTDQNNNALAAGTWVARFNFNVSVSGVWVSPTLNKGSVYRIQWEIKRETATTMSVPNLQIFRASDEVQIAGNNDFRSPGNGHLFSQDNGQTRTFDLDDCLRSLTLGENGPLTWNATGASSRCQYGAVAVSDVGFPGPYVVGEHAT